MVTTLVDTQTTEIAQSTSMTAIELSSNNKRYTKGYSTQQVIAVTTPSAGAFTAAASDICTKSSHGMKTGLKVQVSSTTTLPAGLSAATDYFIIYLSVDTFSLASSLNNANAGTAIDITDAGTGTHTITPTALAGCNVKFQGSNDNSNWIDLASATNITATVNLLTEKVDPMFDYVRAYFTMTAGQISITQITTLKGE